MGTPTSFLTARLGASCIFFASALGANAATITQTATHPAGESWNTTTKWSDGLAPSIANDYVNSLGGTSNTRTPTAGNPSFAGNSLTITNGGSLLLKTTSGTSTVNLSLEANNILANGFKGAALVNGVAATAGLAGTLLLTGTGTVTIDAVLDNRTINVSSLLTADATVSSIVLTCVTTPLSSPVTTTGCTLTNSSNTFAGLWDVQQGQLKGSGFGTGSFQIGALGYLDFDSNYNNTSADLTILSNGKIHLDQDLTFGSATLYGVSLTPGVYTGTTLMANGTYGSAFDGSSLGSSTLTIVPEPSTAMMILGGMGIALSFRRSRLRTSR